jgi:hypothetical protein
MSPIEFKLPKDPLAGFRDLAAALEDDKRRVEHIQAILADSEVSPEEVEPLIEDVLHLVGDLLRLVIQAGFKIIRK